MGVKYKLIKTQWEKKNKKKADDALFSWQVKH